MWFEIARFNRAGGDILCSYKVKIERFPVVGFCIIKCTVSIPDIAICDSCTFFVSVRPL